MHAQTHASWQTMPFSFCMLAMHPDRISSKMKHKHALAHKNTNTPLSVIIKEWN